MAANASQTPSRTSRRRLAPGWRWVPLILAPIALLAAIVWDRSLKQTDAEGFCPENAECILAAEDFGAVWLGVEQSDTWSALCQELRSTPIASIALDIRHGTGIRPNPVRWSAWMGKRFLAAKTSDGWGVCVYPGLLLRGANRVGVALGRPTDADGIARHGPYAYAWREGFLIVSTSKDYVRAALAARTPGLALSNGRDELRVSVPPFHDLLVRFRAKNGWPVEGQLHFKTGSRKAPLTLANAWPDELLCSISATHWSDVRSIINLIDEPLRGQPWRDAIETIATSIGQRWDLGTLPADWDEHTDECAIALASVDTTETMPVPSLAILLRNSSPQTKTHPLAPLLAPLSTEPYEWNGQRGVSASIVGESLTACLCRSGDAWIATTNESLMATLAGKLKGNEGQDADAAIRLNWRKLSIAVERLLTNAGSLELFPGMNENDVEEDILPVVKAMANLGTLHLEARNVGLEFEFSGDLANSPTLQAKTDK